MLQVWPSSFMWPSRSLQPDEASPECGGETNTRPKWFPVNTKLPIPSLFTSPARTFCTKRSHFTLSLGTFLHKQNKNTAGFLNLEIPPSEPRLFPPLDVAKKESLFCTIRRQGTEDKKSRTINVGANMHDTSCGQIAGVFLIDSMHG